MLASLQRNQSFIYTLRGVHPLTFEDTSWLYALPAPLLLAGSPSSRL